VTTPAFEEEPGSDPGQGGPIAITGAGGRLGRALQAASPVPTVGWDLPEHNLDRPESAIALLERDQPATVIHTAAMTDVDACARDPERALLRNGTGTGVLAEACRSREVGLLVVSTNEVFDGERTDGQGYREDDQVRPRNPYGTSKLAGEEAARTAFAQAPGLWIVRTAWLYGPPGNDFPDKIMAAADRLPAGQPLPVVDDEYGSPTYAADLAVAIFELMAQTPGGVFHLVNGGVASRREWADRVLAVRRPGRTTTPISRAQFERASDPPAWGVLDTSKAVQAGVRIRSWHAGVADHASLEGSS
jgi:dTDP-4-dehydrorhamnose reductase